jgi:hypothetical protein
MSELVPIVVGFLLTTVAGGGLGYFFQTRSWRHQHDAQRREAERERAEQAFEEVSRLLDKRLYRLDRLYSSLRPSADADHEAVAVAKMADYQAVLYEWNDNINRTLAVIQLYFGVDMRDRVDYVVGRELVELGRIVSQMWHDRAAAAGTDGPQDVDDRLSKLHVMIYKFNLDMLRALQSGTVGLYLPDQND